MNDLPESMQEDPLGACRGLFNACLIVIGGIIFFTLIIFIVVFVATYAG